MPTKMQTIHHLMEAKGVFAANPANPDSRDPDTGEALYSGPVTYPKMFYHPKGETKITVPAEIIETPLGVKLVGEQRELIWQLARNQEEETRLRASGWHDHPAKAIEAGGGHAPPISADTKIQSMELTIKQQQIELDKMKAEKLANLSGRTTKPVNSTSKEIA